MQSNLNDKQSSIENLELLFLKNNLNHVITQIKFKSNLSQIQNSQYFELITPFHLHDFESLILFLKFESKYDIHFIDNPIIISDNGEIFKYLGNYNINKYQKLFEHIKIKYNIIVNDNQIIFKSSEKLLYLDIINFIQIILLIDNFIIINKLNEV